MQHQLTRSEAQSIQKLCQDRNYQEILGYLSRRRGLLINKLLLCRDSVEINRLQGAVNEIEELMKLEEKAETYFQLSKKKNG